MIDQERLGLTDIRPLLRAAFVLVLLLVAPIIFFGALLPLFAQQFGAESLKMAQYTSTVASTLISQGLSFYRFLRGYLIVTGGLSIVIIILVWIIAMINDWPS